MSLKGKKVAIIATDYFEEIELTSPRDALVKAGATVHVIAPHDGEIKALNHVEPGQSVAVDKTLEEANPHDYDGVVIPGGVVNADHLRTDKKAQDFVREALTNHKPTAVICHGPWLLVSSGVLRGKKLTSYHTIRDDIVNAGGEWVDEPMVQSGVLITSRKPDDLPVFNEALLQALGN
ncbi:MAG TPA: type 1 glutamine amidotransferase domain-containing protein [Candidatus Saccharimonadales bacterium]|nr:type 1 glutamine amidotransferase domain-containing protein [Candidatus Saccharimonadales bacterium]